MAFKKDKKVTELKAELGKLRLENSMGQLKNYNKIWQKKKEIAKRLTKLKKEESETSKN